MLYNDIINKFYSLDGTYSSNNLTDYEINYIFLSLNFYKTIDGEMFSFRDELHGINKEILSKLERKDDFFIFKGLLDREFKVLNTALKTYSFIKETQEELNIF